MTWPTGSIPTTNTDAGTDSPASARADLLAVEQALNLIIANGQPVTLAGNETIGGAKTFSTPPGGVPGRLLNIQTFTAGTSTYSKTAGTTRRMIYVQGGGGAGGGCVATTAGQSSMAGPGGAGFLYQIFSTYDWDGATIVVGAAKSVAGTGVNGADGNASSISKGSYLYQANGGFGGAAGAASSTFPRAEVLSGGQAGGSFTSAPGDLLLPTPGSQGSPSECVAISSTVNFIPAGGATPFGSPQRDTWGYAFYGGYGSLYGGGGYGSCNGPSAAARASGQGLPGIVIIYEYS